MIRTDMIYSDLVEEEGGLKVSQGNAFENFTCPTHPGYKLEALCTKENFSPSLLCVKCLIDPEVHKQSDSFVPIDEVINKGTAAPTSEQLMMSAREKLERKFVEFSAVDYLAIFERHSDSQLMKLNKEIVKIKESLDDLMLQFKQLFEKESNYLKEKHEEIKVKTQQFIDEQESMEGLQDLTREEILDALTKLNSIKDYERILKVLHHRASMTGGATENVLVNEIFEIMDDIKSKVNTVKNQKIDTSRLEEIRRRIDSVEMFDQSLQIFPASLNTNLAETLDMIRNADKSRKRSASPKHSSQKKRAEFLGPLQEKIMDYTKREDRELSDNQMIVEETASFQAETQPPRRHYRDDDEDYYRRMDEERYRKRQKMHAPPYRERYPRDRDEEEDYRYERDYDRYDNDDDFGYSAPVKSSVKSKTHKKSVSKDKGRDRTSSKDYKKSSVKRYEEERRERDSKKKSSMKKHKGSLDKWVKSEKKDKKKSSKKKGYSSDESESSPERSGKKTGRKVQGLHDWINRRITGYLVFQNTIRDNKPEKESSDDHLNALTGKMWKEFSKSEREEYKNLALDARADFKRDYEDVSLDHPDLKELQESIERRLKKIKKE